MVTGAKAGIVVTQDRILNPCTEVSPTWCASLSEIRIVFRYLLIQIFGGKGGTQDRPKFGVLGWKPPKFDSQMSTFIAHYLREMCAGFQRT